MEPSVCKQSISRVVQRIRDQGVSDHDILVALACVMQDELSRLDSGGHLRLSLQIIGPANDHPA